MTLFCLIIFEDYVICLKPLILAGLGQPQACVLHHLSWYDSIAVQRGSGRVNMKVAKKPLIYHQKRQCTL